jgi:hypothetical protein
VTSHDASAVLLEAPIRYWKCPSCDQTDRTQRADVHTQFHNCAAIRGFSIPLVEVKDVDDPVRARQVVTPGAVRTERLDGSNDVTVFPNPALATVTT